MFDAKNLLEQMMGSGMLSGAAGSVLASMTGKTNPANPSAPAGTDLGSLAGSVMGMLTGQKAAGGTAGPGGLASAGGLAMLGGLAMSAYNAWQASQAASAGATAQHAMGAAQTEPLDENAFSVAMLRAMITAAKADGMIDADEQQKIFAHLDTLDLEPEARDFVMNEMQSPIDLDEVVAGVNDPQQALQIYTASFLAMKPDDSSEHAYLDELGNRLNLDPGLTAQISKQFSKRLSSFA